MDDENMPATSKSGGEWPLAELRPTKVDQLSHFGKDHYCIILHILEF